VIKNELLQGRSRFTGRYQAVCVYVEKESGTGRRIVFSDFALCGKCSSYVDSRFPVSGGTTLKIGVINKEDWNWD
jgi:hypothetical protein